MANRMLLYVLIGKLLAYRILGFNIDTSIKNMVVIPGPPKTMFGFSTVFAPVDPNGDSISLLIGAPRANVTPDTLFAGAYHLCENILDPNEKCAITNHVDDRFAMVNGTQYEQFGRSLAMTSSQNFTVCSPLWKDTTLDGSYLTFIPGRCSLINLDDPTTNYEIRPYFHVDNDRQEYMKQIDNKFEYYHGLANFGFSADSDKNSIFTFGAPGVLMSEGSISVTDVRTGQLSVSPSVVENKLLTTAYSYLGYSVKIGRFCDGVDRCIAASAPNQNRVGMVFIYRWVNKEKLTVIHMFDGQQAWSSFGYALCAVDINNDGYDELLVGSPFFSDLRDKQQGHDQGRVFVYARSPKNTRFSLNTTLEGDNKQFARFGSAIQNIGDINLDKFPDVAVSAPGEDQDAGCIYIYLGGVNGLRNSPSQRITAKQLLTGLPKPLKGFGFAFSDHVVPPKQKYPIFAVTSVASDTVIIFKTRPVVDVEVSFIADPNPVDADKSCPDKAISGGCFKIRFCLNYTLREFPTQSLSFKVGLDIDVQVRSSLKRALIRTSSGQMVESVKDQNIKSNGQCLEFTAVLRENQVGQDRLTPIQIVASYSLDNDTSSDISPILDSVKSNSVTLAATFVNKCGNDIKCDVALSLNGFLDYKASAKWNSIVVSSTEELQVKLAVKNSGEPSYWTAVKIEVDSPLKLAYSLSGKAISCSVENTVADPASDVSKVVSTGEDKTLVVCSYFRPFEQGDEFDLDVVFNTQKLQLTKKTLKITAEVIPKNINSMDKTPEDNIKMLFTDVDIIANISLTGFSSPSEFAIYEAKKVSSKESSNEGDFRQTGSEIQHVNVTHKFLIKNNGPSFLPATKVKISVPMYLMDRTQLIHEADVKIATTDGRESQCYGTKTGFLGSGSTTVSLTSPSFTTTATVESSSGPEGTKDSSASTKTPEETTWSFFPGGVVNKRKRRKAGCETDQDNTYTLCCERDPEICQVFECRLDVMNPNVDHAEINVSLVIDKANIPIPENVNEFQFEITTHVEEPDHPLFKSWNRKPLVKTITKFYLLQSGGKVNIWIIIGSVIAGLVLITIIVLVFWKLGFFKREKHNQVEQWKRESKRRSRKGYSKAPSDETPGEATADGAD